MLAVDGSLGEGGGQILRTALALSSITGQPFRISRLRAARSRPGLLRQHLTAVRAAAEVSAAEVEGAALGSLELSFRPGRVSPGAYRFDVGSAGSAMLVLQTVLPPLLLASGPSRLDLAGGTHNPSAPPFDFVARAFLPLLARMGAIAEARLGRHGFYPAGGGAATLELGPCGGLAPLELVERGPVRSTRVRALLARLPRHVGERELAVLRGERSLAGARLEVEEVRSAGPGNAVVVEIEAEELTEVVTAFGARGVPAEEVARRAAADARRYLASGVAVGEHLADQLLLPLALAGGGAFTTLPPTPHFTTNAEVIRRFLPVRVKVESQGPERVLVRVEAG